MNALLYLVISHYTSQRLVDRIQASAFVDAYNKDLNESQRTTNTHATVSDLQTLAERFLAPTGRSMPLLISP
ncbi:hypothetical protein [Aliamphritea spongicola]|nr:hypothetical protein [Aliamphritea spongicola]